MAFLTPDHVSRALAAEIEPDENLSIITLCTSGMMTTIPKIVFFSILAIPVGVIPAVLLGMLVFTKYYFLGVTNRRLLLLQVSTFRPTFSRKSCHAFEWVELGSARVKQVVQGRLVGLTLKDGRHYTLLVPRQVRGFPEHKRNVELLTEFLRTQSDASS